MNGLVRRRSIGEQQCLENTAPRPLARLVLAHGAGAPMDSEFMNIMADLLVRRGVTVLRFEFPYMQRRRQTGRRSPPDRQPVLLHCWRALIAALGQEKGPPLFVGGKSMGGRMATLVMDESNVAGIVCLGYPFHPAGKPDALRTGHLRDIQTPVCVVQGSRDAMGSRNEVAGYELSRVIKLHWLDEANHDLKPLRRTGYDHFTYLEKAADHVAEFLRAHV